MTCHRSIFQKEAEPGPGPRSLVPNSQPRALFLYTSGLMKTNSVLTLPHSYMHERISEKMYEKVNSPGSMTAEMVSEVTRETFLP